MSDKSDQIVQLIIATAKELSDEEELEITSELNKDTPLFGENGILDSMGLVSLVVALEQAIEEEFDAGISLADEKAMSQKHSPYKTIGTLAQYSESLIEAENNG